MHQTPATIRAASKLATAGTTVMHVAKNPKVLHVVIAMKGDHGGIPVLIMEGIKQ